LTTGEIAKHCNVTDRAVLKWVASGKIKFYRTPGGHSRVRLEDFVLFLREYGMPVPAELEVNLRKRKRILIVEDDKVTARTIEKLISKNDQFTTEVTYDGFSAGFMVHEFNPDLITLDIMMPMVDGYEVIRKLKNNKEYKNIKVLVITGIEDEDAENKMKALGADDFIRKPIEPNILIEKVNKLLQVQKVTA
ncbi:MAG: response regulator, partial [Candidatus Omnitrophica bacterium]|nr:response regulator [Candidatus Omnitrophota bacterium]